MTGLNVCCNEGSVHSGPMRFHPSPPFLPHAEQMCPLRRGNGGGARQTVARLQEGRTLTLIHKNRNVPRDESPVTCARRRTEVLLCLPSRDEHLLSNKDTSREEGREGNSQRVQQI